MVFSILGLVNFAHGELVTVAGYTMYLLNLEGRAVRRAGAGGARRGGGRGGADGAPRVPAAAGRQLRDAAVRELRARVIIQNLFLAPVSPRQKGVPLPDLFNEAFNVGGFTIGWLQIITTATCAVALLALTMFLRRSTQGLGMLAAAQDFQVARLMGIPANRVIATAFAISGLLAGIAAIFILARRGTVEPAMGFKPVLKAFIASVIGGLGSLTGAVLGGFVLAAIEVGLDATLPDDVLGFRDAFALALVIAILYFRPEGLLGRPARRDEGRACCRTAARYGAVRGPARA